MLSCNHARQVPLALQARSAGAGRLARGPAHPSRLIAIVAGASDRRLLSKVTAATRDGAAGSGPAPYGDALLQREYELWQRQSEMFDRLQEQHGADLARFAAERATWQATEAGLRAEAAELRAQLLYVMAQLSAAQAAGGGSGGMASSPGTAYPASSQQAAIVGRESAGALPPGFAPPSAAAISSVGSSSSSSGGSSGEGLSGGEQIKALIDAMKPAAGSASAGATSPPASSAPATTSSSPVSASQAWPAGADTPLPAYAADLAAAVAAVDESDVLAGLGSFYLQERRAPAAASAQAAPAAPPTPTAVQQPVAAASAPAQETPGAAAEADAAEQEAAAVAAEKAARGPPPLLALGADDIFWVSQLHTALVDMGYYPGDDDVDVFFFGDSTLAALMTMQCCEGLPETGLADEATWAKLLGPELTLKPSRDLTADMNLNVPGLTGLGSLDGSTAGSSSDSSSGGSSMASPHQQQAEQALTAAKPAYAELFSARFEETATLAPGGGVDLDCQRLSVTETATAGGKGELLLEATMEEMDAFKDWPVLLEGDGGREVHSLHIALERAGYYAGEDDERWWSFGDGTVAALKTFQACSSYPESGVCDAATWRLLLGQDAHPSEILKLRTGDSGDEDLSSQNRDRVWLMGEQRWEDRSRLKRG